MNRLSGGVVPAKVLLECRTLAIAGGMQARANTPDRAAARRVVDDIFEPAQIRTK